VARGDPECTRHIAAFVDGEGVASRISECGGGGQAHFLAVSNLENAENRPNVTEGFISRFNGLKIRCE
jgi:hypothetical protein